MWGIDMGAGCKVRIGGANGREGFEWQIRVSDVGLDGEGGKRNLGLDRGVRGERQATWEGHENVGGMSVRCRWNVGGMSCTEKWRDGGYDGDVNRSKVQEIRGLEGVGGVGARA